MLFGMNKFLSFFRMNKSVICSFISGAVTESKTRDVEEKNDEFDELETDMDDKEPGETLTISEILLRVSDQSNSAGHSVTFGRLLINPETP